MQAANVGVRAGALVRPWGLGGSDVGAILGLSPYRSPLQVWLEKVGADRPVAKVMGDLSWPPTNDVDEECLEGSPRARPP